MLEMSTVVELAPESPAAALPSGQSMSAPGDCNHCNQCHMTTHHKTSENHPRNLALRSPPFCKFKGGSGDSGSALSARGAHGLQSMSRIERNVAKPSVAPLCIPAMKHCQNDKNPGLRPFSWDTETCANRIWYVFVHMKG